MFYLKNSIKRSSPLGKNSHNFPWAVAVAVAVVSRFNRTFSLHKNDAAKARGFSRKSTHINYTSDFIYHLCRNTLYLFNHFTSERL